MTENTNEVVNGASAEGNASNITDVNNEVVGNDNPEINDKVAYSSYRESVAKQRKYKSERDDLKARLKQYEEAELEREGKQTEVIEKLRKENQELYGQLKNTKASFAETQIRSQVERKAIELGCIDTEALTKLMDYDGLDITDGYKVSEQSLDMVLQKAKSEKAYLFSKPAPNIQDAVPSNVVQKPATKKAGELSIDELKNRASEIDKAEGKTLGW